MVDEKENCNCGRPACGQGGADAFTESIEEEIRSENWQLLWKKYGKFVSSFVAAVIISVAVYNTWRTQDGSEREAISNKFSTIQSAIMSGNASSYISQIREMTNISKTDYAVLAKLEYAAILRERNDLFCLDQYKSIFENKNANIILKELAYILYVNSFIDLKPPSEIIASIDNFIKELAEKYVNGSWPLVAKESLAFCYIKSGKNDLAKQTLESIAKTSGVPPGMEDRAKILLNSLS
ncbi:MAG: tetratricopeptide repeat protein [Holosporales bacterium]|jgi:hypothetical protein|nr:tetratricopeptide repeat protein [Holosporales bacterium]